MRVKHEVTGEKISDTEWTGTAQREIRRERSHIPSLQDGRVRLVGDARLLTRAPAMRGMECTQLS